MLFNDASRRARSSHSNHVLDPSSSLAYPRSFDEQDGPDRKRKRVQRACDMCRLKKLKCEGGHPSRKACSNCVENTYDCTFLQTAGPEVRGKAYVKNLETRLARMERLVRQWCPDQMSQQDFLDVQMSSTTPTIRSEPSSIPSKSNGADTPVSLGEDSDAIDSDDDEASTLDAVTNHLQGLSIDPPVPHLAGKSSILTLIRAILDNKDSDSDVQQPPTVSRAVSSNSPHFWEISTWESPSSDPRHHFLFPDDDMIPPLVDAYFKEINTHTPLLHRQTFEYHVACGHHLTDDGFGATLLLVCALGSRYLDDLRVYPLNDEFGLGRIPGLHWFMQVQQTILTVKFSEPRLYDLQTAVLVATYVTRTSKPQLACWLTVGQGIRMIQSIGAHRKKVYTTLPPIECELLKRTFWILIKEDRDLGYNLGRPSTMQDEDFDVDLPIECDDEYWAPEDPKLAFKQPEGKPSKVTAFIYGIKLSQIQSYAMRTIYSITKAKVALGHVGSKWQENTVMELDSALNQWVDSLPEHLRWNPKEPGLEVLTAAARLHAAFYNIQMTVHRPFIETRRPKSTAFPSLTICTNAARSAVRILDVQFMRANREGKEGVGMIGSLIVSGMILLFNVLGAKRAESTANVSGDIELIKKAIYMLLSLGATSQVTKLAANSMCELMRGGGLPVPDGSDSPYTFPSARNTSRPNLGGAGAVVDSGASSSSRPRTPHSEMSCFTNPSADATKMWSSSLSTPNPPASSHTGNSAQFPVDPIHPPSGNTDAFLMTGAGDQGMFEWPGEGTGYPDMGFRWEELGALFTSAFGADEFGASGGGNV